MKIIQYNTAVTIRSRHVEGYPELETGTWMFCLCFNIESINNGDIRDMSNHADC